MAGQTKTYTLNVDGDAAVTMSSLRQDAKALDVQLRALPAGSAEAQAALAKLADVKATMQDLREEIKNLDSGERLNGIINLTQGIAGGFGVATVAAQSFGLSGASVEKFEKKLLSVITVLQSLEGLRAALESQNLVGIKSLFSTAAAYDVAGLKAAGFGAKARAAIIGTGIGILLIGVGLLIANFDKVEAAAESIYKKFQPFFDGMAKGFSLVGDAVRTFLSKVTFGLVDDVATAARAALNEADKAAAAYAVRFAKRQQEYADAVNKTLDVDKRAALARATLANATEIEIAAVAVAQAQARVEALRGVAATDAELRTQMLEARAAVATAEKTLTAAIKAEREQREKDALDAFLKRTKDVTPAASTDPLGLGAALLAGRKAVEEETARTPVAIRAGLAVQDVPKKLQQLDAQLQQTAPQVVRPIDIFFDLHFEDFKATLAEGFKIVGSIVNDFTAGATLQIDATLAMLGGQLETLQARQQEIDTQLADTSARLASDEAALLTAQGARRTELIARIDKERVAEAALRKEKAAAAAEEKKAEQERQALEKQRQKLQASATEAARIQTAVESVLATITLVRAANDGGLKDPNPYTKAFTIAAIAASGVAAALSVKSALKFADGGPVSGEGGPREDKIPAMLSNGEYVVNAEATSQNRALLDYLNFGTPLRYVPRATPGGYADGGPVGTSIGTDGVLVEEIRALRSEVRAVQAAVLQAPALTPKPVLRIGYAQAEALSELQAETSTAVTLATQD